MQIQVNHVIVHTPEQVAEILSAAIQAADQLTQDGVRWEAVFAQACQLLGARHTLVIPQEQMAVSLPQMAIPRGRH